MMNWKHQTKIGAFLIMMLFMLHYLGASAFAEFGLAPPPASDMSRSFLDQIFGSLLDGGQDAFGNSIKNFNASILVVGGILAAYTIFAGTLGTAHDGEMLGRKFSSVWIPIRYALGTALVLPILSGGYCIMQGIVMWLIMQGVSIANGVWSEYMHNPPSVKATIKSQPSPKLVKFVEDVYLVQLCVLANQKLREGGADSKTLNPLTWLDDSSQKWDAHLVTKYHTNPEYIKNAVDKRANQFWRFGIFNNYINNTSCGTVKYIFGQKNNLNNALDNNYNNGNNPSQGSIANLDANSSNAGAKSYIIPSISNIKNSFKTPDYSSVIIEHYNQMDKILEKTKEIATSHIATASSKGKLNPNTEYTKIYQLAADYNSAIVQKAKTITENNPIAEASTANGWFIAGAWVTQIIIQQNKLNSVINSHPEVEYLRFGTDKKAKNEDFSKLTMPGLSVISNTNEIARTYLDKTSTPAEKKGKKDGEDSELKGSGASFGSLLGQLIAGIDLTEIKNDDRHPIIIMSVVGHNMLDSILVGLASIMVLSLGSLFTGPGPFITFFGALALPIAGFIGVAATLSYLLPNMPFLLWIGIIIGWSVMCVEAIIAAPLWAVMHLHPDGNDLTGRGGNGYMLVLGLLLRPALIIFGLIAAIVLSGLFGQLINAIFLNVFLLNQGDGPTGFMMVLFGTGLYAAMMMTVIKQTFNLMHVIPDQLLRWIGGTGESLGQYAGASTESMTKASMIGGAAAGFVAQQGAQAIASTATSIGNRNKEKEQRDENLLQQRVAAESQIGAGAGDAYAAIDKRNPSNTRNAISEKSDIASDVKGLGTAGGQSYLQKYAQLSESGLSHQQARSQALTHAAETHLGAGATGLIQKLAGPNANSSDFSRSLQAVSNLYHNAGRTANGGFDAKQGQAAVTSARNLIDSVDTSGNGQDATKELRNAFSGFSNSIVQSGVADTQGNNGQGIPAAPTGTIDSED